MPRPERPVSGDGPLADLARALRLARDQAASPGYRELSLRTRYSRETLSAAARGEECPSWDVTKAFANACDPTGTTVRRIYHLWEKAAQAGGRRRSPSRHRSPSRPAVPAARQPGPAEGAPRPDPAGTPAQYVYQLRALRAWAGNPGRKETGTRTGRFLASSTMYDALRPGRATLPPLDTVQVIVRACFPGDDAAADEWAGAWRVIALHEFTRANPPPSAGDARPPLRIVASH